MPILLQNLRLARSNLLGFGLGLALLTFTSVLFLPSLKENGAQLQQLLDSMPKAFLAAFGVKDAVDMLSPEGFLQGRLFGLMVPLLLIIQGIGIGAATLAGEEERGQLELIASHPVARTRLYLQKLGVLLVALLFSSLMLFLSLWIGLQVVKIGVASSKILAACLGSFLLGGTFGSLALALGAWTGRRSLALGLASALALAAYLWNALTPLSQGLIGYQKFSPFFMGVGYEPIRNGLEWGYAFTLLALALLVLGLGLYRFTQRDLGT
jgi:ABC-2 type transport system permease protein